MASRNCRGRTGSLSGYTRKRRGGKGTHTLAGRPSSISLGPTVAVVPAPGPATAFEDGVAGGNISGGKRPPNVGSKTEAST